MSKKALNPLEALVQEGADAYVALVHELADELAPVRPWWTAELSPDEQLWRWIGSADKPGPRDVVMPWLMQAAAYLGATDAQEALGMIERIFTDASVPDIIPPDVVIQIPTELLEIVQASGPAEAAKHIRKMEKMVEGRSAALAVLANTDQPELPVAPPPLPIDLPGYGQGWPQYGGAPGAEQAAFAQH